jgi:bacterioferritin-associated ferredoxin
MYVCLCQAVTNTTVHQAIEAGATTTRKVGESCGAGMVCGRCRRNVRAMIRARKGGDRRAPGQGNAPS